MTWLGGADDLGDPMVAMLTRQLQAGCVTFETAYTRGRELDRAAAIDGLDPDRLA